MRLSVGTRLGPYEVVAPIGAGGMGEVYKVKDTRLDREVAVKVLPDGFAEDAERLARFEREAKLLASLNHPNIATVHGFETAGEVRFLVMELVDGETLAERIERGALSLEDALAIAGQMAEGLEAAHEKGIVHRDLKPANVKVTEDGVVKILDFGLAKGLEDERPETVESNSPTLTRGATQAGVLLGTAAYMSPEQARGQKVDRRTDIWAFGVVLFEMLTGTRCSRARRCRTFSPASSPPRCIGRLWPRRRRHRFGSCCAVAWSGTAKSVWDGWAKRRSRSGRPLSQRRSR